MESAVCLLLRDTYNPLHRHALSFVNGDRIRANERSEHGEDEDEAEETFSCLEIRVDSFFFIDVVE